MAENLSFVHYLQRLPIISTDRLNYINNSVLPQLQKGLDWCGILQTDIWIGAEKKKVIKYLTEAILYQFDSRASEFTSTLTVLKQFGNTYFPQWLAGSWKQFVNPRVKLQTQA